MIGGCWSGNKQGDTKVGNWGGPLGWGQVGEGYVRWGLGAETPRTDSALEEVGKAISGQKNEAEVKSLW